MLFVSTFKSRTSQRSTNAFKRASKANATRLKRKCQQVTMAKKT